MISKKEFKILCKYQNSAWEWDKFFRKPDILLRCIKKYPGESPWDKVGFIKKPTVEIEEFKNTIGKKLGFCKGMCYMGRNCCNCRKSLIFLNPNCTIEILKKEFEDVPEALNDMFYILETSSKKWCHTGRYFRAGKKKVNYFRGSTRDCQPSTIMGLIYPLIKDIITEYPIIKYKYLWLIWNYLLHFGGAYFFDSDVLEKGPINNPWFIEWYSNGITPLDFIERHLDKSWKWEKIRENRRDEILPSSIEKGLLEPEDCYRGTPRSLNYPMEIILKYPEKKWNWLKVSRNHAVTLEFVKSHENLTWNWRGISQNKNITIEDILNNPGEPWNVYGILRNPNLLDFGLRKLRKYLVYYVGNSALSTLRELDWPYSNIVPPLSYIPRKLIMGLDSPETIEEFLELLSCIRFSADWIKEILSYLSLNKYLTSWLIKKFPYFRVSGLFINSNWTYVPTEVVTWDINNPNILPLKTEDFPPVFFEKNTHIIKKSTNELITKEEAIIRGFHVYNATIKIQKWWKNKLYFLRWKKAIEDTNIAIKYNPKIKGIEFLKELEIIENDYLDEVK